MPFTLNVFMVAHAGAAMADIIADFFCRLLFWPLSFLQVILPACNLVKKNQG